MSDETEFWKGMKKRNQAERSDRRDVAEADFASAADSARQSGLTLLRCSETHYQLRGEKWIINLHPGNQRISRDRNTIRKAPVLDLPMQVWTLMDAVRAAIKEDTEILNGIAMGNLCEHGAIDSDYCSKCNREHQRSAMRTESSGSDDAREH